MQSQELLLKLQQIDNSLEQIIQHSDECQQLLLERPQYDNRSDDHQVLQTKLDSYEEIMVQTSNDLKQLLQMINKL